MSAATGCAEPAPAAAVPAAAVPAADVPAAAVPAADAAAEVAALTRLARRSVTDSAALSTLIARTRPAVWRTCAALVDRGSADDLTQETFLRAVRSLGGYRGEAGPGRWLQTIARRVCAEEIGRRQRARELAARLRAERCPTAADATGLVELADALDRLAPERREAFVLTAVAGLPYAAAARACDCPVGTIRSRVARARGELVRSLGDPGRPVGRVG